MGAERRRRKPASLNPHWVPATSECNQRPALSAANKNYVYHGLQILCPAVAGCFFSYFFVPFFVLILSNCSKEVAEETGKQERSTFASFRHLTFRRRRS